MQPKSATERLRPATKREIAIELERLRSVFGYEAAAWETAAPLYLDALADLPYDLLTNAVANSIRMAGIGDRFPRPGQLRALIAESLELRRDQGRRESRLGREEEEWPGWLGDIWGPPPEGPLKRREALAEHERKRLAPIWRPPLKEGVGSFVSVGEALGVSATERKVPKHEDPAELRKAAIELGIYHAAD